MQSMIDLYKKAKDRQVDQLKKEISIYQSELENVEKEILYVKEKLKNLNRNLFFTPLELRLRTEYFFNLKKELSEKIQKKQKLNEKIDKIKENLLIVLGEKKAIEKYETKLKKRKQKEEERKLTQLGEEVFNNRRLNS